MNKPGIKQVEVQIMSQSYLLACPQDGEAALREAVSKVDAATTVRPALSSITWA